MPDNALPSGSITIRIEEPANRRVIVSALEVVEPGFLVVDIPTIPQGVSIRHRASSVKDFAIGVILVTCHYISTGIHQLHYITL